MSLSGNLGMFTAFVFVGIDDTSTLATARGISKYSGNSDKGPSKKRTTSFEPLSLVHF